MCVRDGGQAKTLDLTHFPNTARQRNSSRQRTSSRGKSACHIRPPLPRQIPPNLRRLNPADRLTKLGRGHDEHGDLVVSVCGTCFNRGCYASQACPGLRGHGERNMSKSKLKHEGSAPCNREEAKAESGHRLLHFLDLIYFFSPSHQENIALFQSVIAFQVKEAADFTVPRCCRCPALNST